MEKIYRIEYLQEVYYSKKNIELTEEEFSINSEEVFQKQFKVLDLNLSTISTPYKNVIESLKGSLLNGVNVTLVDIREENFDWINLNEEEAEKELKEKELEFYRASFPALLEEIKKSKNVMPTQNKNLLLI